MTSRAVRPDDLKWITRPHDRGEAPRHVAELSDLTGFAGTRANIWRYGPGAKGRRHRHALQEETFVVLAGTLSMYLGDLPERHDVPAGGLIHVRPGTALQTVNHGDEDLVVYAYGMPPMTAPRFSTPRSRRAQVSDLAGGMDTTANDASAKGRPPNGCSCSH